jgi:hypothetical protein
MAGGPGGKCWIIWGVPGGTAVSQPYLGCKGHERMNGEDAGVSYAWKTQSLSGFS